jgi:hypothetical protein
VENSEKLYFILDATYVCGHDIEDVVTANGEIGVTGCMAYILQYHRDLQHV